jgi:hypothetical protein
MAEVIRTVYQVLGAGAKGEEPSALLSTRDILEAYRFVEDWLRDYGPGQPEKIPGEAEARIDKVEEFDDGEEISRVTVRRVLLQAPGKTRLVPV